MEKHDSLKEIFDKVEYKHVSKQEFEAFLEKYPRKLSCNITGMCEPPAVSYNDFELGKWPQSVVASTFACCDVENNSWRIMVNYEEIYAAVQEFKTTHGEEEKLSPFIEKITTSPIEAINDSISGDTSSSKCYEPTVAELIITDPITGKEIYRKIIKPCKGFSTPI